MSDEQFFFLEPDHKFIDFILDCKKSVKKLIGDQQYLQDSPHLTLLVGNYEFGNNKFFEELEINHKFKPIQIELDGWFAFKDDPVTKKHTIVYKVSTRSLEFLKAIQIDIGNVVKKYRKTKIIDRYKNQAGFSSEMVKSTFEYGFPFVGDHWRAHFTIASIEKEKFDEVWNYINKNFYKKEITIRSLNFSSIEREGFKTIRRWD